MYKISVIGSAWRVNALPNSKYGLGAISNRDQPDLASSPTSIPATDSLSICPRMINQSTSLVRSLRNVSCRFEFSSASRMFGRQRCPQFGQVGTYEEFNGTL